MSITSFQALACPLDGNNLLCDGASWRCAAGHSFDIARQGYTHLLPVQNKRSRDPGDSKGMVAARQRFLNAGFYQPIAAAVNQAALENLPSNASCLDAGCGEGYYLRQLAAASSDGSSLALLGLDISKWAILSAAKQYQQSNWVVASNANLPVQTNSLDRVLCIFGFPVYSEFARVLKPGGEVVQVDAGPDHLRELREIIYSSLKAETVTGAPIPEGFTQLTNQTIRYPIKLTNAKQVSDLLAMTPHFYRASSEGRARASALMAVSVTVDVRLIRLGRG